MKFLSKYVNRKILELSYTMHVRPHLEYGDIIYHNCAEYLMDKIESIQYQAGLIATGCWKILIATNFTLSLDGNPSAIEEKIVG